MGQVDSEEGDHDAEERGRVLLAAELWTLSALVRQVRKCAVDAGFPRLAEVGKTTVWRILNEQNIKPHRARYYLEKRDPEFDRKMREVLLVYQKVSLYAESTAQESETPPVYTVSVDEKPGVQAIELTAPDLPPIPGGGIGGARLRVCSLWYPVHPRSARFSHRADHCQGGTH